MNQNYQILLDRIQEFLDATAATTDAATTQHRQGLQDFAVNVLRKQGAALAKAITDENKNCDGEIKEMMKLSRVGKPKTKVEKAFDDFANAMEEVPTATSTTDRLTAFGETVHAICLNLGSYPGMTPAWRNYILDLRGKLLGFGVELKGGGNGSTSDYASNYASTLATSSSSSVP
jgi:hypothetical protein